jgi:Holliday junction resolvasome RuvABC endonuclease subunit
MMMTPIGADLSLTSTGYSGFGESGAIASKNKGVERLDEISSALLELAARSPEDPIFIIEGYSFSSRNSQAHSIGELGGVVRYRLWKAGFPFIDIPPTCRAKFATGRGNASKNEVMSSVSARTGIVFSGKGADDICDAWILEEIGLYLLGNSRFDWPASHVEALAKLDTTLLA